MNLASDEGKECINSSVARGFANYVNDSEFKKLALMIIAHRSNFNDDIFKLRKVFESLDVHQNGTISYEEFKKGLEEFQHSDEDLYKMFRSADVCGDGLINYTEFLAATLENVGHIEEEQLLETFEYFDSNNTGFITEINLKKILGKNFSEER